MPLDLLNNGSKFGEQRTKINEAVIKVNELDTAVTGLGNEFTTVAEAVAAVTAESDLYAQVWINGVIYSVADSAPEPENGNGHVYVAGSKFLVRSDFKDIDDFERIPKLSDVSGVFDNANWQYGGSTWAATRVYAGQQASWLKDMNGYTPAGADSSAMQVCCSLKKVISSYTGPCINVTSVSSGLTVDVGFNASGDLDTDYLFTFLRQGRGVVNAWYDQTGNNNHLTSTGDNRPVITLTNEIGNSLAILFESRVIYNGTLIPEQFLTIPTGVSVNSNSFSVVSLSKFASTIRSSPVWTLDGSTYAAMGYRDQSGVDCLAAYVNNSLRKRSGYQPSGLPEFLYFTSGASSTVVGSNDFGYESGSAVTPVSLSGGKIGSSDSGLFVDGNSNPVNGGNLISHFCVYDVQLPTSSVRYLYETMCKSFDLKPQVKNNVVFDGDSITEGAFQTYFNNWPKMTTDFLGTPFRYYNVARSGGTTASQIANQTNWINNAYNANSVNTLIVCVGTNDLGSGGTAAATYADLKTYCHGAKAAGWDIIVGTVLPRASFVGNSKETERLSLNDMIRSGWKNDLGCDGLLDNAAEKTMGSVSKVANTTYYADGTHITDTGAQLLANYAAEYLRKFISSREFS